VEEVEKWRKFVLLLPLLSVLPLVPVPVRAQSFAAASIKRSPPERSAVPIPEVTFQPGRLVVENTSLRELIIRAFGVPAFRIEGGPEWMMADRFDITASAGRNATAQEMHAMLRGLLAERFQLRTRTERRELPVYELRLARDDGRMGPRLQSSSRDCSGAIAREDVEPSRQSDERDPCRLRSRANVSPTGAVMTWQRDGIPMSVFATMLTGPARRVVVDRTGLTGVYDIDFSWSPDAVRMILDGPEPFVTVTAPVEGLSLRTALRDQLGLSLDAARSPVDVLVIEAAQLPTPD
jgi:uncharacterized protein (TIGR03435 family)